MNDLDKIERALAQNDLSAKEFERCAQDLLIERYPTLVPIPGGTDWGRDGDASTRDGVVRLIATSARTLDGVRKNMYRGIKSMTEHGVSIEQIILANPASLSTIDRKKLEEAARSRGVTLRVDEIYDRGFFASKLRRDAYWRVHLLGLSAMPTTLARRAPEIAESPWAFMPLVARGSDLETLKSLPGDVIITGPAGVGKSRLLSEVPDVVFVNKDADFAAIAADLRWASPPVVGIDDAVGHEPLVRQLLIARSTEPDVFAFRVAITCWPDWVEAFSEMLPAARQHKLQLVARGPMDELLQQMGISSQLARTEILQQAEGRPGWAVALGSMLLRARDASSLLDGRALLGQVRTYLRRSGASSNSISVLALIALLGDVSDVDVSSVAKSSELRRGDVVDVLRQAARSGIIDITDRFDRASGSLMRVHAVRPRMLAVGLVAEYIFGADTPFVDVDEIFERWPSRHFNIARAAVEAARLGHNRARSIAHRLVAAVLEDQNVEYSNRMELAGAHILVDRSAADYIIGLARESLDSVDTKISGFSSSLEPLATLAALAIRHYSLDAAILLLFDLACLDGRETNANPSHPLRQLADIISSFHPEVERDFSIRLIAARMLESWVAGSRFNDDALKKTFSDILVLLFNLNLRSAQLNPGVTRQLQLIETVVTPVELDQILAEVWPIAESRIRRGDPDLDSRMVDVLSQWFHIGSGYDKPFGQDHPHDRVVAINGAASQMLMNLDGCISALGARIRLQRIALDHGQQVEVGDLGELSVFFRSDIDAADWNYRHGALAEELKALGRRWAKRPCVDVLADVLEVRQQVSFAQMQWPDRFGPLFDGISAVVTDPLHWFEATRAAGLIVESIYFIERAQQLSLFSDDLLLEMLASNETRRYGIGLALKDDATTQRVLENLSDTLSISDISTLEILALRHEINADAIQFFLNSAEIKLESRSLFALSLISGSIMAGDSWVPSEIGNAWTISLSFLTIDMLEGVSSQRLKRLVQTLIVNYPVVIGTAVGRRLQDAVDRESFPAFPIAIRECLGTLPASVKDSIWLAFQNQPWAKNFLLAPLAGADTDWVASLVDRDVLEVGEAFEFAFSFGGVLLPRPSIEELSNQFVPRGIDPERIAATKFSGSWTGEESTRYQAVVSYFEQLLDVYETGPIQAVAAAGKLIFSEARDRALERERLAQVRGG